MSSMKMATRSKAASRPFIKEEDTVMDNTNSIDDFIVVDDSTPTVSPKQEASPSSSATFFSSSSDDDLTISLVPLPTKDGVLVSINPPRVPPAAGGKLQDLQRVPVDIVLVIDVSWSMNDAAPLPDVQDQSEREAGGLSILDLTKHAARTILETLNDGDRLGIVTFAADSKVIQPLTHMTKYHKGRTRTRINSLDLHGYTNLWAGIRGGLQLFEEDEASNESDAKMTKSVSLSNHYKANTERASVKGMYVLTDGQPNHMCPPQGYVNKLRPILAKMSEQMQQVPTIHTFGFGFDIRSELLQSIAETGNGNYAFIPDAGMIGTVFGHAVANLYATFAVDAILDIEIEAPEKPPVKLVCELGLTCCKTKTGGLVCNLGNLQYGQSRNIIFDMHRLSKGVADGAAVARLKYRSPSGQESQILANVDLDATGTFREEMIQYHIFRRDLCALLSSLFPLRKNNEHGPSGNTPAWFTSNAKTRAEGLARIIQDSDHFDTDPNIRSLYQDIVGEDAAGQVLEALTSTPDEGYWQRWGRHYLPSLLHAHMRQVCNSFKDPGPLRYGIDSPLFIKCRDELDKAFDNLPPPKASRAVYGRNGMIVPATVVSMSRYNWASNPCFEGNCSIRLGNDQSIPIRKLMNGMKVWTPVGPRFVAAILKTKISSRNPQMLCRVGKSLWVTPWHPVKHGERWIFPAEIAEATKVCLTGTSIYSVLLAPSADPDAHAIEVGGQICVTLGHGLVPEDVAGKTGNFVEDDARVHPFFGDYIKVMKNLVSLPMNEKGCRLSQGVRRDPISDLANGFAPAITRLIGKKPRRKPCRHGLASRSNRRVLITGVSTLAQKRSLSS